MEEEQEQKRVCKFCYKEFPCGRSLGGHMRSHMRNTSSDNKLEKKASSFVNGGSSSNTNLMELDSNGGQIGYGLREKPKKTWKLSDSIDDGGFKQEKLCKECGRGFPSWKALCGHMRCHSERERVDDSLEEDDSWIMDSQSDTETAAPRRRQRSSRRNQRYKNTTTVTASSSFSFANASSSITGIEQEQEEVALCLMMLSRDVGSWGGLNSVNSVSTDSEENNSSVLVEVRSSITVTKTTCNADQIVKRKKSEKSIYGFSPNELKKSSKGEMLNDQTDLECGKYWNSSKRKIDEASRGEESLKKMKYNVMDSPSKSKYQCTACNKTFHSYQALGGHRASHKKAKGCCGGGASKIESSETSIDNNHDSPDSRVDSPSPIPIEAEVFVAKKNKHECPVCYKVFASGQALGGHKRSHVLEASNQTIVIQQKLPQLKNFLDLNLPAPEEDNNGRIGFNPWWIGNGNNHQHQHEQATGLIFN